MQLPNFWTLRDVAREPRRRSQIKVSYLQGALAQGKLSLELDVTGRD